MHPKAQGRELSAEAGRHRRIVRSETPTISAACHQLIRFAIARRITSCTFIARSTAALGYPSISLPAGNLKVPAGLSSTLSRAKADNHLLIRPDKSSANDTSLNLGVNAK